MKIKDIHISKFRSVENGKFHFNQITAIVGQNNTQSGARLQRVPTYIE
jgi:predicted ATP-dependent endonuclease of OLD family